MYGEQLLTVNSLSRLCPLNIPIPLTFSYRHGKISMQQACEMSTSQSLRTPSNRAYKVLLLHASGGHQSNNSFVYKYGWGKMQINMIQQKASIMLSIREEASVDTRYPVLHKMPNPDIDQHV